MRRLNEQVGSNNEGIEQYVNGKRAIDAIHNNGKEVIKVCIIA